MLHIYQGCDITEADFESLTTLEELSYGGGGLTARAMGSLRSLHTLATCKAMTFYHALKSTAF